MPLLPDSQAHSRLAACLVLQKVADRSREMTFGKLFATPNVTVRFAHVLPHGTIESRVNTEKAEPSPTDSINKLI